MTVDLDTVLNGCPPNSHKGRLPSGFNDFSESFSEAHRASLGCYYLSSSYVTVPQRYGAFADVCYQSSISSFLLKPNTLSLDGILPRYSKALTRISELESDLTMKSLIQYQQVLEDVLEVYRDERKTSSRLHLQTKQMTQNLDLWWLSLPQHIRSMGKSASLRVTGFLLTAQRPVHDPIPSLENTDLRNGIALSLPS
jgi:hypothetical protein